MRPIVRVASSCILVCLLVATGCSGGGGGGGENEEQPGSVMGRIRGVTGGDVLAPLVTVGGATAEKNEQGWFFATDVEPGERVEVRVEADGYLATQRFVTVHEGRSTFVDIRLFAGAAPVDLDASAGGTVAAGSGGLTIPGNAFRVAGGGVFSGTAKVSVTILDPTEREAKQGVPGGFEGVTLGGESVDFESFGMLNVAAEDAEGNPLSVDGGEISFPPPAGAGTGPSTVPLWRFDVTAGTWVEDGMASWDAASGTYTASLPSGTFAAAPVADEPPPTVYWNADMPYDSACLEGRVVNPDGEPATGGVEVTSEGIDYIGSSTAYTDDEGRFRVRVKASAAARVYAQGGGLYSDTPLVVDPTPSELASTGNCGDLGDMALAFPLASMVLTWGELPSDLDSHFTGPDGLGGRFHVYYGNQDLPQASLDTDDTSSYGPEVTSLLQAIPGEYVYAIHNYSGEAAGPIKDSGATIRTFFPDGYRELRVADATGGTTDGTAVWRVLAFEVSGNGAIGGFRVINEIVPVSDAAYEP